MSSIAKRSGPRSGGEALLEWYRPRGRAYPWRRVEDPYAVMVSEVMLQQTQASRVVPVYAAFLERFPTVERLALAQRADVVRAWNGLGYHRRAVAVSEAARAIVRRHEGRIPASIAELRRLPGIGPYTAAAIASLAYDVPVAAIDTNVRRVVARVHLGVEGHHAAPADVAALAGAWLDRRHPGDWNSAVMDLGREVCRARPRCGVCPLASVCAFRAAGTPTSSPPRRQDAFDGSARQVRGAVVRALRGHPSRTLGRLVRDTGFPLWRLAEAASSLAADGIVTAGPVAMRGGPNGRMRLSR